MDIIKQPSNAVNPESRLGTYFHLHLVSDGTGETLNSAAKAATAQFESALAIVHGYALVRTRRHLDRVLGQIEDAPGIVFYTIVNEDLRTMLEARCEKLQIPCLAILDPIIQMIGAFVGAEVSHKPGGQHIMNTEYFQRIEALQFTMAHDDGQSESTLNNADVILVGVSRTSKTPTCIYLANRGLRAANVPIVPETMLPTSLETADKPLIVGLTTNADRLVQVRRNRLLSIHEDTETMYTDIDKVEEEVRHARRLFTRKGWPVIDVTRRSIEETAAAILNLLSERQSK